MCRFEVISSQIFQQPQSRCRFGVIFSQFSSSPTHVQVQVWGRFTPNFPAALHISRCGHFSLYPGFSRGFGGTSGTGEREGLSAIPEFQNHGMGIKINLGKTAFKLFGGKRSICTLPSFFGGRGKKGLSKCKTHEGLSSAACDRGGGTGRDSPSGGSRDGQHAALASSRSAQLATDSGTRGELGQQDSSPPGSMEGWDKKPSGEKPSFPRPKKGLKGFFTSIRRHRKSKAAERAAEGRAAGPEPEGAASPGGDSSSGQATEPTGPVADGGGSEGDTTASFDSLTGCGDDIAEPDIAESSVAVERGRDAAKRSSCLVTYQGGGEEMAIPEENEDYLQQVWDSGVPGDSSYGAQVSSSSLETHASHEADAHPYMDGVDMLTPQSDQQESAPNSDEGYYDSTTPGPDDEAGEELKKDRLPRDSYSGDALYEFDALMSPSHGEESLFEGKVPHQGIFSYFMDFCLPAEKRMSHVTQPRSCRNVTEAEYLQECHMSPSPGAAGMSLRLSICKNVIVSP
uniref:APC membrane recruitment protein 1 n=1 Tax=Ficedula albicollis TaxID=59894 RepID=A0A803WDP5_FICAL